MLSAVAARNARLAAAAAHPPSAPADPPPPPEKPTSKPPSASKRKAPVVARPPSKKKRTEKPKRISENNGRYFDASPENAFAAQQDLIVISDDDDDDDAELSGASLSSAESVSPPVHLRPPTRARKWSPSVPAPGDSESDSQDEFAEYPPLSTPLAAAAISDAPPLLSTFSPIANRNVFHSQSSSSAPSRTILLLKVSETIALLGAFSFTLLRGRVSFAGATLNASSTSHRVYSPRSSPLPILGCLARPPDAPAVELADWPSHALDAAKDYDAVLQVEELDTGITGLGKICRTFDGFFEPSRWRRGQKTYDLACGNVHLVLRQTPDVVPLTIPSTWSTVIDSLLRAYKGENTPTAQRSVFLIKGPRNTGKSTFARYLLNQLLSRFCRVAYLECDPGQPEFTTPGLTSLSVCEQPVFGPAFSHPSIPYSSHFIGATSPRSSPTHYLESIQALMQTYCLDVQNACLMADMDVEDDGRIASVIPLIVNTMGWTKGQGADLAIRLDELVEPSDVFTFEMPPIPDTWGRPNPIGHSTYPSSIRLHSLDPAPPSSLTQHYTAADYRTLSLLSYLHAQFPSAPPPSPYGSTFASSWDTSLSLCAQPPYEVDWATAFDKLVLTGAGMEDVVPSEVHRALNCALVGLVSCDPGALDVPPSPSARTTLGDAYTQGAPPPPPSASRCVGLALVRALAPGPPATLQLLTPVPPRLLGAARVLVMGELALPVWGMLDARTLDGSGDVAGVERARVPFLRWGKAAGVGSERRRVRRNLQRRAQH